FSGTSRRERCRRMYATKSRILEPCGALDGDHEDAPRFALLCQLLAPGGGELVEASSPLSSTFDPPARDAALRFKAIEDRIQRGDVEHHRAVRTLLDACGNVVAMPRLLLELGEDEQFRCALFQGVFVGGCGCAHISQSYIYEFDLRCQSSAERQSRALTRSNGDEG